MRKQCQYNNNLKWQDLNEKISLALQDFHIFSDRCFGFPDDFFKNQSPPYQIFLKFHPPS